MKINNSFHLNLNLKARQVPKFNYSWKDEYKKKTSEKKFNPLQKSNKNSMESLKKLFTKSNQGIKLSNTCIKNCTFLPDKNQNKNKSVFIFRNKEQLNSPNLMTLQTFHNSTSNHHGIISRAIQNSLNYFESNDNEFLKIPKMTEYKKNPFNRNSATSQSIYRPNSFSKIKPKISSKTNRIVKLNNKLEKEIGSIKSSQYTLQDEDFKINSNSKKFLLSNLKDNHKFDQSSLEMVLNGNLIKTAREGLTSGYFKGDGLLSSSFHSSTKLKSNRLENPIYNNDNDNNDNDNNNKDDDDVHRNELRLIEKSRKFSIHKSVNDFPNMLNLQFKTNTFGNFKSSIFDKLKLLEKGMNEFNNKMDTSNYILKIKKNPSSNFSNFNNQREFNMFLNDVKMGKLRSVQFKVQRNPLLITYCDKVILY